MTASLERFFAVLALAAFAGAAALLVARVVAGRAPVAADFVRAFTGARLPLTALVTAIATAGSLYFSEVAHFEPCKLCWFQRIAMYPCAVLLVMAAVRKDLSVRRYVLVLASGGAVASAYHCLVLWRPSLDSAACRVDVPCTSVPFTQLGFVSLPVMALAAFLFVIVLLTLPQPRSS